MANEAVIPPEICPNPAHDNTADWVGMTQFGMFVCNYGGETPQRCKWAINMWTPESDAYTASAAWVVMWKQAWGY